MSEFARQNVDAGGVVLFGASHFEWCDTGRWLPGLPVVNRGIAGDGLGIEKPGMVDRLQVSAIDVAPACIVFQGGGNDLGDLWRDGVPAFDRIVEAHRRVLHLLRESLPEVRLIVLNTLPTTGRFAGLNPFIVRFNPFVAEHAATIDAVLVDMHGELVDGQGALPDALTTDGLHLSDAGYEIWRDVLLKVLRAGG